MLLFIHSFVSGIVVVVVVVARLKNTHTVFLEWGSPHLCQLGKWQFVLVLRCCCPLMHYSEPASNGASDPPFDHVEYVTKRSTRGTKEKAGVNWKEESLELSFLCLLLGNIIRP